MAWFAKQRWSRQQADLERKALAASVEEITAQDALSNETWDEEESGTNKTAIFPPLLRLQSRPWPVVRVDTMKRAPEERVRATESRSLTEPRLPISQTRRLGRSTKVHLQAVRPEQIHEPITERFPTLENTALAAEEEPARTEDLAREPEQSSAPPEPAPHKQPEPVAAPPQLFMGSGIIEQGREEVTVASARISAQSVVVVMLTGNPGPVVVQYISLQPESSFTCHLSAPVSASTPFNYLVWTG